MTIQELQTLNPQQKQELLGATLGYYRDNGTGLWENDNRKGVLPRLEYQLPNYLHDLDAVAKAEQVLTPHQRDRYMMMLGYVVNENPHMADGRSPAMWKLATATAEKRTDALLLAVGVLPTEENHKLSGT